MLELVLGAVVGLAALALVLEPLLRPSGVARAVVDDGEPVPLEESDSPRVQALLALREIEFDRATGKLSDDDYEHLRTRYAAQALAAIRAEETAAAAAPDDAAAPAGAADAAEELIRQIRSAPLACPAHGPRPETDAIFCSECGRALRR